MSGPAVFFDLASLGALWHSPASTLERLDLYPHVHATLTELEEGGVRLGIVTGGAATRSEALLVLEPSGLSKIVEPQMVVEHLSEAAGVDRLPESGVFVAEDRDLRKSALDEGWRVSPHPRLAGAVLEGEPLRYLQIGVPTRLADADWRRTLRSLDVVPLRLVAEDGVVYAIATSPAVALLDGFDFEVSCLGAEGDPVTTEVYLVRDDLPVDTDFQVLATSPQGCYVAVPAGRAVASYHADGAQHGHTRKLVPDPSLLEEGAGIRTVVVSAATEPRLGDDECRALRGIAPEAMKADLSRYTGEKPVGADGKRIRSRNISNPGNRAAVQALVHDLQEIGGGLLDVRLHAFVYDGLTLHNVEAEMRGAEPGEIVLVSAHLDSTTDDGSGPYDPVNDLAPGADDDGSGIVAVLAIARALVPLGPVKAPKRTIRFVLFNAEESGSAGSKAFARGQAAVGARLAAVFMMDMIGYNRKEPKTFEVHVGFKACREVEERSKTLAERVRRAALQVSPELPPPQIYPSVPGGSDPGDERSDHASFHEQGYAACCISEDYFGAPPGRKGQAEPNPNYHTPLDTFVDFDYAASIARAVGGAVWMSATL